MQTKENRMYYPLQIPYVLNGEFSDNVSYTEDIVLPLQDFIICFWEMQAKNMEKRAIENIILADGCIDLVVLCDEKKIGFTGMRKTSFHFKVEVPGHSLGARLVPGAFHQLTGLPAVAAMDTFLPLSSFDHSFDQETFFSLPPGQMKHFLINYLSALVNGKTPDLFTSLFHRLSENIPPTAQDLYSRLHFSPRQCQRLFATHYGIAPKLALSILRFQHCLNILTSPSATAADALNDANYYDQPHFIRDFKQYIGITPLELIQKYRD